MARDIRTRLIADDDMTPAFKSAGRSAERLALDVEGAQLRVQRAAKAAAAAEQRFGKEALQAKEAAHKLAVAELELAAATDKTKESTDKASRSMDRSNGVLKDVEKTAKGSSTAFRDTAKAIARVVAPIASVVSLVGPLSTALIAAGHAAMIAARGVAAAGHAAYAMAPATAALPAFAAGFELVKGTVLLGAPAIVKAFQPITDAFVGKAGKVGGKNTLIGGLREDVGKLAAQGLPALAQGFLKVNFPQIRSAMLGIAISTNRVVVGVGKWVNSRAGQAAIHAILVGTLQVTRKLSELIPGVVASFGNMVGRAAGPGFAAIVGLGPKMDHAAAAVKRLFDSTSSADVGAGFKAIGTTFGRVKGAIEGVASKLSAIGHAVLDVGNWMNDNKGKVKVFSDVLAGVGIALGIYVGAPIAIVIGSLTLLANHWDLVKGAVSGVVGWFRRAAGAAGGTSVVIDGLRGAVAALHSWWADKLLPALKRAGDAVMPAVRDAVHLVSKALVDNKDVVDKVKGVLTVLGIVFTEVVIPVLTFVAQVVLKDLAAQFTVVIWVINRVVLPALRIFIRAFLWQLGLIVHGAAATFGWIPGIGPKLKEAAGKFDTFANQVNNALSGIKDQKVQVRAAIYYADGTVGFKGSTVKAKKDGGLITGPGGPRDDRIPTMLSNREYVVNADATSRNLPLLEAINAGRVRGYRDGGLVMSTSASGIPQMMAAERKALAAAAKRYAGQHAFGGAGSVGAGVQRWAPLVLQVLAMLGQSGSALGPVLSRMSRESAGNPRAINNWDINALRGDPSRGLMQTIGGTFNAYAGPFRGRGIYDPLANIYAGVNYAIHRYGAGWVHRMGMPGGYDQGGVASGAGLLAKMTRQPERVLSPRQTVSFERLVQVADRGGIGGGGQVHFHFGNYIGSQADLVRVLTGLRNSGRLDAILARAR